MSKLDQNGEQLWSPALVTILVAVTLLPPGAAPVAADTPAVATPSDQPAFHQDRITENRGDVATVGVNVGNRSNVTLHVEPADESASQFTAEVVISDRNEDGQVDVQLNTYELGNDTRPVSASGTDTVQVRESADLDHRLRVGEYRLTLEAGNETVDQSTLAVKPASLDTLRVLTANSTEPRNLSSRAAVETAIENGTFEEDSRFSVRDTLLVELEASGLSGPLASQPGPNATAKFLNLLDQPGYSLTFRKNESTIDTQEDAWEFWLTAAATTVVADQANDTYYVLLDVDRMPRHEIGSSDKVYDVDLASLHDVNFTVAPSSGVYETRQSLTSQLEVAPWVTVDAPLEVEAGPNQTVEMRSNLGSTWRLRVVLRSNDGWSQSARTVEVEDDGTIVATFDLSNRSQGESLALVVEHTRFGVLYSEQDAVHVRSPTPSPTTTATLTPTKTATAPDPTERTPTETPGSAPGFGAVAALVALAVALVAAGRRRR